MSLLKQQRLERQIKKLEQQLMLARMEKDSDLSKLNYNWGVRFDMIIGIFEQALEDAGTLGEAKKWYKEWTKEVNACDSAEEVADMIERHGFEFELKQVVPDYKEMVK